MDDTVGYPSTSITRLLTDVEKVKLERFEGQEFVEQDVYLDGREYVKCTFRHCRIFVRLGRFVTQDCNFDGCNFDFTSGPAQMVSMMMEQLIKSQQQKGAS
jgi:hypothetical protein